MRAKAWVVTIEVYDDCDPKPLTEKEITEIFDKLDLDAGVTISVSEVKEA